MLIFTKMKNFEIANNAINVRNLTKALVNGGSNYDEKFKSFKIKSIQNIIEEMINLTFDFENTLKNFNNHLVVEELDFENIFKQKYIKNF